MNTFNVYACANIISYLRPDPKKQMSIVIYELHKKLGSYRVLLEYYGSIKMINSGPCRNKRIIKTLFMRPREPVAYQQYFTRMGHGYVQPQSIKT